MQEIILNKYIHILTLLTFIMNNDDCPNPNLRPFPLVGIQIVGLLSKDDDCDVTCVAKIYDLTLWLSVVRCKVRI